MGNEQKAVKGVQAQVYLRWVGVRLGVRFESVKSGPWDAHVEDGVIALSAADKVELDGERKDLETYSLASGLTVEAAIVGEGVQLGEWRPVDVAVWKPVEQEPAAPFETSTTRAAAMAMDLCAMIDAMPDGDAVKIINVLKARLQVSMTMHAGRKAVANV